MNSPYALDDTMTSGDARPTSQARVATLENLLKGMEQDKQPLTEEDL